LRKEINQDNDGYNRPNPTDDDIPTVFWLGFHHMQRPI